MAKGKKIRTLGVILVVYGIIQFIGFKLLGEQFDIIFCIGIWGVYFIMKIVNKLQERKMVKMLQEEYNYLKVLHKQRYKLCFDTKAKEKVAEYSTDIQELGETMLNFGEYLKNCKLTKKQRNTVIEITNKTKECMENTHIANY